MTSSWTINTLKENLALPLCGSAKSKRRVHMEQLKETKKGGFLSLLLRNNEIGTLFPLLALCAIVAIMNPSFLDIYNLIDVLRTASYSFIVAIPVTFMMISGGMDLSIGAVTSLGSVLAAITIVKWGLPVGVAIPLTLALCALVGLFNGLIIMKLKFPPFIVTLATQYMVNGFLSIITRNTPIAGLPAGFLRLGQGKAFGAIYYSILIALALGILGHIVLTRSKFGRAVFATGGNIETASLAGIHVVGIRVSAYMLCAVFAGLAGVIMCSRFSSGQPIAGTGTEMVIMAAVIIGGTSLSGGIGSIVGSGIGCVLFAVITNGLIFMKISTLWQNFIFGAILLLSICLDNYRRKINGTL